MSKNAIRTSVMASIAALATSTGAQAQAAAQWTVANGGNGHWYSAINLVGDVTWFSFKAEAEARGAHLATVTSAAENQFVFALSVERSAWFGGVSGPYLGARKGPDNTFAWVTGEPFIYANWLPGERSSGWWEPNLAYLGGPPGSQTPNPYWNDTDETTRWAMIEWSADCNSDGIVDYGQCHDGTLADYDSNNIPDCCEQGEVCVVGSYPVQWKVSDGGNGHWYEGRVLASDFRWAHARSEAMSAKGDLASLSTEAEAEWVYGHIANNPRLWNITGPFVVGPWFGARSTPSGWTWTDGTPWSYSNWYPAEGTASSIEQYGHFYNGFGSSVNPGPKWADFWYDEMSRGYIIEWSADCNNDGVVDYGQILNGQLADADSSGIPDVCEQPTCSDADLFPDAQVNGADLAALLSQWGPSTSSTVSDINLDGRVDGADLSLLLSFWGPCAP